MKLVVDTNRIIAAVLRDGMTRKLLRSDSYKFCTVTAVLVSLAKHK
jgi:predicted nucleic acid-binding protein